jgi:hypothetical protein
LGEGEPAFSYRSTPGACSNRRRMGNEAAFAKLMESMASAQRNYDATLSAEERQLAETCECQLCQGMRQVRQAIADYEKATPPDPALVELVKAHREMNEIMLGPDGEERE